MGREARVLRFRRGELILDHTILMGIVNATPDSFVDGGRFTTPKELVDHALQLADEGAEILDLGGESTRPEADPVPAEEEWRRLEPVLTALRPKTDARISVDTYKPDIAAKAIELGADMVNDVTGLRDPRMIALVAKERVPVVVMHMQGEPKTMNESPAYRDVVSEVRAFLLERAERALGSGIARDAIIVDPGLGFGKSPHHNVEILHGLGKIGSLGYPVLVGASHKSFVGIGGSVEPSLAAAVLAVENGAHILRVHEVGATAKAINRDTVARRTR
ncbi:MAG TPA: dihydropteroate synthase [Thermoplasmata archaeon]|nr:dihydropteroate synthase [Thermoplasmata archaeon]